MKKTWLFTLLFLSLLGSHKAVAQDPYLGEIRIFAGNFAPVGWMFCNGDALSIADNTALFSIIGTTYGGDGLVTFNLPDFRGRVPMHVGATTGPGMSPHSLGEQAGSENVSIGVENLPPHTHPMLCSTAPGNTSSPAGAYFAESGATDKEYSTTITTSMNPGAVGFTGNNVPFYNMKPYLGLNFIIAVQGIYPTQN